jgi:hypothetical protein
MCSKASRSIAAAAFDADYSA